MIIYVFYIIYVLICHKTCHLNSIYALVFYKITLYNCIDPCFIFIVFDKLGLIYCHYPLSRALENYVGLSFGTISGYGPDGAIIHYGFVLYTHFISSFYNPILPTNPTLYLTLLVNLYLITL